MNQVAPFYADHVGSILRTKGIKEHERNSKVAK